MGLFIWIADAYRDDGKRFIVHTDDKLSALVELKRVTRESLRFPNDDQFGKILPTS